MASVSRDGTVRVWDIVAEQCAAVISPKDPASVCFRARGDPTDPPSTPRAPSREPLRLLYFSL